jgi:hypothetical protein
MSLSTPENVTIRTISLTPREAEADDAEGFRHVVC